MEEYLQITGQSTKNMENKEDFVCESCFSDMLVNDRESNLVCPECGSSRDYFDVHKEQWSDEVEIITPFAMTKGLRFAKCWYFNWDYWVISFIWYTAMWAPQTPFVGKKNESKKYSNHNVINISKKEKDRINSKIKILKKEYRSNNRLFTLNELDTKVGLKLLEKNKQIKC